MTADGVAGQDAARAGHARGAGPGTLLLGRYRLRQLLGSGGSAEVWLAHDERLGRNVALKLLHPHLLPDAESRERFAAEARAVARVSHPGIVGVHDVVIDGSTAAIVFEFVPGETLDARIRRRGRLPATEAADIVAQVAEALAAAHAAGVVHRDVKPGNILMDGAGRPRLADFGIAQALGEAQARFTRQGEVVGTLRSLAPEQLAGWPGTPAADLYALGTVLYEMIAGRPPYDATTPWALIEQQKRPPAPIPDLSPGIAALILRCLQPDPSLRPSSAIEIASYLRGWVASAVPADSPGAVRLPSTPRVPLPPAVDTGALTLTGGHGRRQRRSGFRWRIVTTALLLLSLAAVLAAGWPLVSDGLTPSKAPGVANRGTPAASATPRVTPHATPTHTPTPKPTPSPTPVPTQPAPTLEPIPTSLTVLSPTNGVTVAQRTIDVSGTAPPNATVTRDVPLWFDDHTTADKKGRWSMKVDLDVGVNVLTFRLGGDRSTDVNVTVYYAP